MPKTTREAPRFQIDAPSSQGTWSELARKARSSGSKRDLFRVETLELPSEKGRGPESEQTANLWRKPMTRAIAPFAPLTRSAPYGWIMRQVQGQPLFKPQTLAHSRQRRRLAWIVAVALILAVVSGGIYLYNAPPGTPVSTSGASDARLALTGGMVSGAAVYQREQSAMDNLSMRILTTNNPEPSIQAQAAFVYDPAHGWVFYEKNPDQPYPIASLTKIMTATLAYEYGSLDTQYTVGQDAAALANSGNSYMGLSAGEKVSMGDLLDGLLMAGANDAAQAIADAEAGSSAAFVQRMNTSAAQLGLRGTTFVSPDGVSDGNISTARAMAELSALAIQQPGIAAITSTRHLVIAQTATHKAYTLWNTNELLPGGPYAYQGVTGLKTGYTQAAGYCLAVTASQNGAQIVAVLLGEPSDQALNSDAQALLNWGFAQEG